MLCYTSYIEITSYFIYRDHVKYYITEVRSPIYRSYVTHLQKLCNTSYIKIM